MPISIDIHNLSPVTITRQRGREAFGKLIALAPGDKHTEIDLSTAELISTSFLDELLLRLSKQGGWSLDRVVFVLDSDEKLDRLVKICSLRQLPGYYRWVNEVDVKRVSNDRRPSELEVQETSKEIAAEG